MTEVINGFAFLRGFAPDAGSAIWTREPQHSEFIKTGFETPLWASDAMLRIYGGVILMSCRLWLQREAAELGGIDSVQEIWDRKHRCPRFLLIEEDENKVLGGLWENSKPTRVVAMLADEYADYVSGQGIFFPLQAVL